MAQKQTPTNSSSNRSVFYCPLAPQFTWDLQHTTLPTASAVIVLIASPITTVLNALIIRAISQRKELQKHSNIVLCSIAIAGSTCLYIRRSQLRLEVLFFLFRPLPPHCGCLGEVCGDKKIDGLQDCCDKQPP